MTLLALAGLLLAMGLLMRHPDPVQAPAIHSAASAGGQGLAPVVQVPRAPPVHPPASGTTDVTPPMPLGVLTTGPVPPTDTGLRPGPLVGAIVADGQVIEIHDWQRAVRPATPQEERRQIQSVLASNQGQRQIWMDERAVALQEFLALGGHLDADDRPALDQAPTADGDGEQELAGLRARILDLSAWISMKDEQIEQGRSELKGLH